MGARVDLEAVLHRVTMPLHQAMQLKIGSELTIPYHALETLQIEAIGRRLVTSARLGQANGMRAVRVQCRDETDGDAPQMAQQAFEARHSATSTGARGAPAPAANAMPSFGGLPAGGFGTPTMNGSDLPPLASLPDLPAMADPPLQGSLADIGEHPPLGDLPILKAGGM
jgi:flagellar motor switch protein FliM